MLRRLLSPFLDPAASGRSVALWAVFLFGAPLAFWGSLKLHEVEASRRRLTLTVTRADALNAARDRAAELQLDVSAWKEYVSFDYNEEAARYYHERLGLGPRGRPSGKKGDRPPDDGDRQSKKGPPPPDSPAGREALVAPDGPPGTPAPEGPPGAGPDARRRLPPSGISEVRVLLISPARDRFFRVRLNTRGRLIGWQLGGPGAKQSGDPLPPDQAKELAESTFLEWLGAQEAERLGEPEMERTERDAGASGYRFTWRARNRRLPDTEFAVAVEVQGKRVLRLDSTLSFSESYQESVLAPRESVASTLNTIRILLLVALVAYACWRYTKRSIEHEAPHRRMVILAAMISFAGAVVYLLDSTFAAPQAEAATNNPALTGVMVISTMAVFVLEGLLLGIAYGSGEGDIREGFAGKMTSTDCLLTGRVWSQNVGRSILGGLAVAVWSFLLMSTISASITSEPPHVPEHQMAFAFGRFPILLLLFNIPMGGLFSCVSGLLLPLTFLRRHVRSRRLMLVLLVFGALIGSNVTETPSQGYWNYVAETLPLAVALLAGFFAGDLLTAIVACAGLSALSLSSDLSAIVPYWQANHWVVLATASLPLAVLGAGAWLGRKYEESDVRPSHATNLVHRLQMQAELSAARQAQLRLMPDEAPSVPGLTIAASCTPAREVSGDFYDFLSMADGRLAVVIGEGGNDGLASALTIALTKGYLLYRTSQTGQQLKDPQAILRGLEEVLGSMLRRESGRTSLALIYVDPMARVCTLARLGEWPQVLLLRRDGTVNELFCSGAETAQSLEPGDSLVALTDGIAKMLERISGESPAEVLRRAASAARVESASWLHDEFLAAARGARQDFETGDDITTVVLRLEAASGNEMESAA